MKRKMPAKFKSGGAVKRYSRGSSEDEFKNVDLAAAKNTDSGEWARGENYGDGTTGDERVAAAKAPAKEATNQQMRQASADAGSFGDAFKSARESGDKSFSWRGKSFTTDLAGGASKQPTQASQAAQKTPAKPMSGADAMAKLDRETGVKPMNPNTPRGPNAVTGTETSRNLSNIANALTPLGGGVGKIGAEIALGNRAAQAGNTAVKAAEVASKGREAVTNPMAWAGGPKAMKAVQKTENTATKIAEAAAKAKKRLSGQIPDSATNGGATGYKKGGAVKAFAKGGMVSSASRRADGIAIRGKTKGTIAKMCGGGMAKGKK